MTPNEEGGLMIILITVSTGFVIGFAVSYLIDDHAATYELIETIRAEGCFPYHERINYTNFGETLNFNTTFDYNTSSKSINCVA